ncbi:MAG TPA: 4-hydroxybenzoate octaprenyltransferase [Gammaproteobacteria bacterium]|nr:4-hydroxybenzoate octaprenyltransferase [Gammaproteobacteria bacterium]
MTVISFASCRARLIEYGSLIRLDRPIGFYLLLWPTLTALWIASNGHPTAKLVIIFTLGTGLMRCAGCAINDFFDKDFDPHVKRTSQRPLAKKAIFPQEALGIFCFLIICAFCLVLKTNLFTLFLSCIALLLASLYPLAKRFFNFPQVMLGAAFAWAIPMAFSATLNTIPHYAWLLYFATLFWTIAYDTLYAMADLEDDQKIGIKSLARFLGKFNHSAVLALHALTILLLVILGVTRHFGVIYFLGLSLATVNAIHQQFIIQQKTPSAYLRAFFNNHWMGLTVFIAVIAS